jgi:Arc/MetJ-type ribon-helix-helix transcriptional regulator
VAFIARGYGAKHLPRYLGAFAWRFNRHFVPKTIHEGLAIAATATPPMPYRLLKLAGSMVSGIRFIADTRSRGYMVQRWNTKPGRTREYVNERRRHHRSVGCAMTEAPQDAWDSPEAETARIAQARALKEQGRKGGLRFEAYLPPDLAEWLLDHIERGVFADPSEAVFVILGEHRELEPHADLRHELLRRACLAAIDDPRPAISGDDAEKRLRELVGAPRPEAAVWRKAP